MLVKSGTKTCHFERPRRRLLSSARPKPTTWRNTMPVSRKRRVPRVLKRQPKKRKAERTASGYVVVSAKRAPLLNVAVSREIIDNAIRNSSSRCVIADAIREQYPQYTHIAVDLQTIRMSDPEKGLRYVYLTPRIAQQVLVMWDKGERMRPFVFVLRGAHTVSRNVTNRQKGRPARERIRLGRRRIIRRNSRTVPDTVGGRPTPRHPSSSGIRQFGMRAFTAVDLADVGLS